MAESGHWHFYYELLMAFGIIFVPLTLFGLILWIALSPLYAWKNSYLKEKVGNRWWGYLLLGPELSRPQRNFTRRELIMAAVLALFIIGTVVVDRFFP
jgi:hypothetical protein